MQPSLRIAHDLALASLNEIRAVDFDGLDERFGRFPTYPFKYKVKKVQAYRYTIWNIRQLHRVWVCLLICLSVVTFDGNWRAWHNGLPAAIDILPAGTRGPHVPVLHPILPLQPTPRLQQTCPRYSANPLGLLSPYSFSATRHDPTASPLCRHSCLDVLSMARLRAREASVKS